MVEMAQVSDLRARTGVSLQACKKALEEAGGDIEEAITLLRKRGEAKAVERGERETGQGVVTSYIHSNSKIGVLLQLGCETDFVAKNDDFKTLANDIAMHIAATNPLYVSPDEVPGNLIEKEKEIWKSELANEKKPEAMWDKIMQGKEKKFREQVSLLTQPFVKNPEVTVEQLMKDMVGRIGENVRVVRFARMNF